MNTSSREVKRHLNARRATKEVFFTNLMLLGFEPAREEAKYRVQFTSDMFKVPNKKAFEVVMHFLFKKLDPVMAKEQFRDCWPVTDKKQEQLFRKNVNNWLTHIAAEKAEANLPRIVPSMFLSPGGDKFYNLMLHFSTYVCKKAIIEEHGVKGREFLQHPKLMPSIIHLGPVMAKAERSATISQRKKFLEATQYNGILHKEWQEISHGLTKEHRALKKEIRELERRVEERWRRNQELNGKTGGSPLPMKRKTGGRFDGEMEVQAIKRAQKVQKVRGLWSSLEDFHKSHSQHREILDSVLCGLANRYKIDANDIHVQVPAMLLSECERQIQRRNVGNTYEGGKLNLLSLLHLSNLSLHLYLEKLHQTRLPRFEKMTPKIASDVHTHHAHLANMQALRSKLASEMVPELKESIDNLIAELDAEDVIFSKQTQPTDKSSDGLWLIPPTPPSVYSLEPDADIETPPHLREAWSMSGAPEMVDTPEAVAKLDERITKMAMRRAGLVQGTPVSTRKELREQLKGESKLPRPTSSVKTSMTGRQAQKGSMKIQRPDTIGGSKVEVPTKVAPQETFTTLPQTSQDQKWTPVRSKKTATSSTRYKPALSLMDEQQADPDTSSYQRHQATPSAHDILAGQIASAVTGDGVEDDLLAIKEPLQSLGLEAFESKDKLSRTPTSSEKVTSHVSRKKDEPISIPSKQLFIEDIQEDVEEEEERQSTVDEENEIDEDNEQLRPDAGIAPTETVTSKPFPGKDRTFFSDSDSVIGDKVEAKMEMHLNLNQSEDSMGEEEEEEEIPERGELEESIEGLQQIKTDEMFLSKTPQLPLRSRTRRVPESDHGERLQTPPHSSLNVEELAAITMPITPLSPPMMDEQPSSVMEAKREKMDEDVQQVAVDDVMTNDEEVRERSISSGSQKSVTFSEPGDQHKDSDSLSQKTPEVPESGHKVRDSDSITRELLERLNKLKVQAAQKEGAGRDPNASLAEAFSQKLRIESASSPLDEAPVGQSEAAPVINDIYLTKSPQPKSKSEMREVFTLDLDDSDAELSEGSQVGSPMIGISDIPITLVDVSPVGTPTQTPKLQRAHMSLMSAHMTASKGRGVATEVTMTPPGSKDQSPRQTPSEQSSPPRLEQEESTGRQEPVMEKSHTPTIEETQELVEKVKHDSDSASAERTPSEKSCTSSSSSSSSSSSTSSHSSAKQKSTSSHSQSPKSPPPTPEENYQSQEGSVHSQHSSRQSLTGEISVSRGKQSHKDKASPEVSPLQSPRTELLTTQRQISSKEGSEHESQPETPTGTESSSEVETKQKSPQLSQPDSPRSPGEGEFSNESARPTTEGSSPVTGQTKVSVHSSHSTSPEQSFSDGPVKESSLEKQDDKQIDRISRSSSSDHEISSEDKQDSGHFGSIDKISPDKEPLILLEETTEKELSIDTSQAGSHRSPHLPQGEESAMKQGSLHSSRSVSPSDQKSPINQDDLIKHSSEYDSSLQKETSTKPVSPALLDDSMTPPHESIPMSPLTSNLHSYESAEKQTDKKAEIDIFGLGDESVLIPPSPLSAEDKAPTRDIGSPTDQQEIPEMDEL